MLTDIACKRAVAREKPYKLADEKGLYLLVKPEGRYWRHDYRHDGKRRTAAYGVFPEVSLKEARERRDELRRKIRDGIDPAAERRATKAGNSTASFAAIAEEWVEKFGAKWSKLHRERTQQRFRIDINPWLGKRPADQIDAPEILSVLKRIEDRGALEAAHKARQLIGRVIRYAAATSRAKADPTALLKGALPPLHNRHHPTITQPKQIGALLRAIDTHRGSLVVRSALRLAPLVFCRPGEIRHVEWHEIDLEAAEWRIPAEKMKMRIPHIVPLPKQAKELLTELLPLTGPKGYVFPASWNARDKRPMSENTMRAALRRLGYSTGSMTIHGFRSMASTLLNEQGWNRDAIERQLAHADRNDIRATYNYAEHLPERRRMMQAWADYLDLLRTTRE